MPPVADQEGDLQVHPIPAVEPSPRLAARVAAGIFAGEALILSAHGHIEHALYLVDDGTTTWAHVEPGTQGALIAYLESMKFFVV